MADEVLKCKIQAKTDLRKADSLLKFINIYDDIDKVHVPGILSPLLPQASKTRIKELIDNKVIDDESDYLLTLTKHDLFDIHALLQEEALTRFCECMSRS